MQQHDSQEDVLLIEPRTPIVVNQFLLAPARTLLLLVAALGMPLRPSSQDDLVLAVGQRVLVRFSQASIGGSDTVGQPIAAQLMLSPPRGVCEASITPLLLLGTVEQSKSPRLRGRRGRLRIRFDSVQTGLADWRPVDATLDSLEWTHPDDITPDGLILGGGRSMTHRLIPGGAVAATGIGALPAGAVVAYSLMRRGAKAQILAGEEGLLRLRAPLRIPRRAVCDPGSTPPDSTVMHRIAQLGAHTTSRNGGGRRDPVNLILIGGEGDLDSAFTRARWVSAYPHNLRHLVRGVGAAILEQSDPRAPVSDEYYDGRAEDLAYERASPSARIRHHLRLWRTTLEDTLWAGAATQDVGLRVAPLKGRATHRVDPLVDRERDLLVRELGATGCVRFVDYVSLPGAETPVRNSAGQKLETDGRAAVLRLAGCSPAVSRP